MFYNETKDMIENQNVKIEEILKLNRIAGSKDNSRCIHYQFFV